MSSLHWNLAGHAHAFASDHVLVSTLLIDNLNVTDEASLPTFSYLPQPTDGGPASNLYGLGFEFDKRMLAFGRAQSVRIS